MRFRRTKRRDGTALVLVLAVLVIGAGIVAGVQHGLARHRMAWGQSSLEVELRGALLLGLVTAIDAWENEEDTTHTHPDEPWAAPREFTADNGAEIRVVFRDAQDRFNLNNLSLSPESAPGQEDAFLLLMRMEGVDPDPAVLRDFSEKGETVRTLDEFVRLHPEAGDWFVPTETTDPRRWIEVLPLQTGRPTPLNLNSVNPRVLAALLGPGMEPWVETVARAREQEPFRSVEALTAGLPPLLAVRLGEQFTVRSRFTRVHVEAGAGNTLRTVEALLVKDGEGAVEVLQCLW